MNILLTNHHLNLLGGSETFSYTLANALKRADHEVSILTAEPGVVSDILAKEGFQVTHDPLAWRERTFDIIHCHHNTMALVARYAFPDVPMVFLSHGIVPGLEEPPSVDLGIVRFIGVSEEVCEHQRQNYGIENPVLIRNAVDCSRFRPSKPLNDSPERILILSNHFPEERLEVVRSASRLAGADIRLVGMGTGSVWNTEDEINEADIVVTLGRGALEAMACGRAVMVYDWHGGDGMITGSSYPEIRKNNFSGRRFRNEYSAESLAQEFERYNTAMGEENRNIALENHNIDKQVESYLRLYEDAIDSGLTGESFQTAGRELLFYQQAWRERSEIWKQLVQLDAENQRLKSELTSLQPRLKKLMEQLQQEKIRIEEQKRRLGLSDESPD